MKGDKNVNSVFSRKKKPLFIWIWYSYLKTAIIPLVVVELVFIGIYFFTNEWSQRESIKLLKEGTQDELLQIAKREAVVIDNQLSSITNATELYKRHIKEALYSKVNTQSEDIGRLKYSPERENYTTKDSKAGGAAIYYSGIVPVEEKEREKVQRLLSTQGIMKNIYESQALAAAIYFNTFDSLNIIYPFIDVLEQYAPHLDTPTFNFYYEADLKHNPERTIKWTDAYLDPAGNGWMASAIAPVYRDNFLEGVAGIDVTLETIVDEVLDLEIPWKGYGVLVGKDGAIIALPKNGEKTFGLKQLNTHKYDESILRDTFKPEQYNIYKREDLKGIVERMVQEKDGLINTTLNNEKHFISWSTVKNTGWKLLIITPEKNVFSEINKISDKLFEIGTFMIVGLILFYVLFFLILYKQSRKMSKNLTEPLVLLNTVVKSIGEGKYFQKKLEFKVNEFQEVADQLIEMGYELGKTNNCLKNAQMKLKKRESNLRALVHSIDDIIMEFDKTGVCLNVWTNNEKLLAKPIDKFRGKKIEDVLDEKHEEMIASLVERVFETGKTETIEYEITTQYGNEWFQGRFSPIFDQEGMVKTLSFTARNISDRKKMEHYLIQAKNEAVRASKAKSEFLSSMSHELRTPMNAILGFAQILELDTDEQPLTKSQQDCIEEILKAGNHLLRLINEILDLAKIESGSISIFIEPVEVQEVINEVVGLIAPLAAQNNLTLINRFKASSNIYVNADRTRFKQVLLNLLSNAVKYNKENGTIILECLKINDYMKFVITDTGIGIDSSNLDYVFQPFYRENEINNIIEGTGIGLNVSKQLVELMKGTIHVESKKGVGSKFWFELPIMISEKRD